MKCAEARSSLDAPTLLAVTGDMTATGDEEEFRLYEGYAKEIAGVELLPGAVRCGLAHLGFQVMEVSGNHDRFGGASAPIPLLSGPTQAFVSRHSDQPWISEVIPLAQGFKLRVIGIDGDADATALSQWRLTASGCFRSQIEALSTIVPAREPGEIRVLLLHHSFQETPPRWSPKSLLRRICPLSRRSFAKCVTELGVAVVLTGHHHYWYRTRLGNIPGMESAGDAPAGAGHTARHDGEPLLLSSGSAERFPGLTTVHQPVSVMGERGARILIDALCNSMIPQGNEKLEVTLVVRGSTTPPGRG